MAGKFLYKILYGWASLKVLLENNKFLGSAARVGLVEGFFSQDRGVSGHCVESLSKVDTLILA